MKYSLQTNRTLILFAFMVSTVLALGGCGGGKSESSPSTNKTPTAEVNDALLGARQLCVFSNDDEAVKCKTGQTALFAPDRFGNEQLPVIFAAKYCDFNHPIALTNGAVGCVFFKGREFYKPAAPKVEQPVPPPASSATGG
ncbi:MAG: hypothetical protein ABI606_21780 [Rhodoferax sp.]